LIGVIDLSFVSGRFLGAFLIVYFTAMIFCGIPIFFQEVAIGQYLGSGGMTLVGQLCPILKGRFIWSI
jgi:SNF family Na+-dependent transporter